MIKIWVIFYVTGLATMCSCVEPTSKKDNQTYSFSIDYENNQFLLDGKPFQYVAGSFHYFRAPRQYWRDILRKIRAAGLNSVETYIEWSTHEPEFNKWIWDGDANIEEFIKIAEEEGLLVILRPGPYICAERDFGGFPYWLLNVAPDIKLRTRDDRYLLYAERYLNNVLTKIKPFLRGNGGPVIMVQIENEYGSFNACDSVYMEKLRDIFNRHIGNDAVLFTTDGPLEHMLKCGTIPGVYGTIDFGSETNMTRNFEVMRKFTPKGPLVNSEFYPGWLSHWKQPFQKVDTYAVTKMLDEMLANNVSLVIYVFYGGTNFGFSSGANIYDKVTYAPQLTSYDYDAPLNEARDPTEKYFAMRDVILKYLPMSDLATPIASPKGRYGQIHFEPVLDLFSEESRRILGTVETKFTEPPSFEFLGMPHWLALYEATLPVTQNSSNLTTLSATAVKDRALVYVNGTLRGTLGRMEERRTLELPSNVEGEVSILVENQGRVNYGNYDVEDFKGIWNVRLNEARVSPWKIVGFTLDSVSRADLVGAKNTFAETEALSKGPQFLVGNFLVRGEPRDTFLNTAHWGKGVAYVNGHSLGRYWPTAGPQLTLYVPAPYLKNGPNHVVVLELEYVPKNRTMILQDTPILG